MQGQQFLVLIEARLSNLSYAKVKVIFKLKWGFPNCREPAYCILSAYCILHIECSTFHSIIFQDLE